jgi:uncharacterized protein (UPF0335 family)
MADDNEPLRSNGYDPEALALFVKRIERLQADIDIVMAEAKEECAPIREDIDQVRREAHDAGIGKKELATVIRKRRLEYKAAHVGDKLDLAERANYREMIETLERLAEQMGPLGEAALDRARAG